MKIRIEILTTLLLTTVTLLAGCSGCGQKTAPEHADPYNQAEHGPVAANSRKPVKLTIVEPSFERLIEQFKADVTENKGDPEMLKRKRKAIANPDILWDGIGFEVPPTLNFDEIPRLPGYNPTRDKIKIRSYSEKGKPIRGVYDHDKEVYPFAGKVLYTTKDQEERLDAVRQNWRNSNPNSDPDDTNYYRKRAPIVYEGIDTLIAAKHLSQAFSPAKKALGVEYAERAIRENPNSVEAMRIWVKCHPEDQKIEAYQQLLSKFPNDAFAHEQIAGYYYREEDTVSALDHMLKACQLDSRIAKTNDLLAKCYFKLSEWEKAVAAYQGMDYFVSPNFLFESPDKITKAKDEVHKQRKGYSVIELTQEGYDK
jgi:tetratricopeptide (TPR) repeat protein